MRLNVRGAICAGLLGFTLVGATLPVGAQTYTPRYYAYPSQPYYAPAPRQPVYAPPIYQNPWTNEAMQNRGKPCAEPYRNPWTNEAMQLRRTQRYDPYWCYRVAPRRFR